MKLLVVLCCLHVCYGITLHYRKNNGDSGKIDISSKQITGSEIPVSTIAIGIGPKPQDTDLYAIKDIGTLERVLISNYKKDYIPAFKNLPRLEEIFIEQCGVTIIPYGKISDNPTKRVYLQNNKIKTIEPGAFGPEVDEVHLACNLLEDIRPEWFQAPQKVEHFHISANNLKHVGANTFKDFIRLRHITLGFNKIIAIGANAFPPKHELDGISLFNNYVQELNANVFPETHHLKYLDIRFNTMTYLPKELRNKLLIDGLYFDKNPWQCPCRDEIKEWLNETIYAWPEARPDDTKLKCVHLEGRLECQEIHSGEAVDVYKQYGDVNRPKREDYCNNNRAVCCVVTEELEGLFKGGPYKKYVLG